MPERPKGGLVVALALLCLRRFESCLDAHVMHQSLGVGILRRIYPVEDEHLVLGPCEVNCSVEQGVSNWIPATSHNDHSEEKNGMMALSDRIRNHHSKLIK